MLGILSQALTKGKTSISSPLAKMVSGLSVEKDPITGQQQLKVPMPPKETLQTIAKFIDEFAKKL
jgi:restriction endonuclease S subunit